MRKHHYIETTDKKTNEALMAFVRANLGKGLNAWTVGETKEELINTMQED